MNIKLSNQELKNATKLMRNNTIPLFRKIKGANDLIIKALYYAHLSYSYTNNFINHNLNFYAPLDIKHDEKVSSLYPYDVQKNWEDTATKQWINTLDLVITRAKKLCVQSEKRKEFSSE